MHIPIYKYVYIHTHIYKYTHVFHLDLGDDKEHAKKIRSKRVTLGMIYI